MRSSGRRASGSPSKSRSPKKPGRWYTYPVCTIEHGIGELRFRYKKSGIKSYEPRALMIIINGPIDDAIAPELKAIIKLGTHVNEPPQASITFEDPATFQYVSIQLNKYLTRLLATHDHDGIISKALKQLTYWRGTLPPIEPQDEHFELDALAIESDRASLQTIRVRGDNYLYHKTTPNNLLRAVFLNRCMAQLLPNHTISLTPVFDRKKGYYCGVASKEIPGQKRSVTLAHDRLVNHSEINSLEAIENGLFPIFIARLLFGIPHCAETIVRHPKGYWQDATLAYPISGKSHKIPLSEYSLTNIWSAFTGSGYRLDQTKQAAGIKYRLLIRAFLTNDLIWGDLATRIYGPDESSLLHAKAVILRIQKAMSILVKTTEFRLFALNNIDKIYSELSDKPQQEKWDLIILLCRLPFFSIFFNFCNDGEITPTSLEHFAKLIIENREKSDALGHLVYCQRTLELPFFQRGISRDHIILTQLNTHLTYAWNKRYDSLILPKGNIDLVQFESEIALSYLKPIIECYFPGMPINDVFDVGHFAKMVLGSKIITDDLTNLNPRMKAQRLQQADEVRHLNRYQSALESIVAITTFIKENFNPDLPIMNNIDQLRQVTEEKSGIFNESRLRQHFLVLTKDLPYRQNSLMTIFHYIQEIMTDLMGRVLISDNPLLTLNHFQQILQAFNAIQAATAYCQARRAICNNDLNYLDHFIKTTHPDRKARLKLQLQQEEQTLARLKKEASIEQTSVLASEDRSEPKPHHNPDIEQLEYKCKALRSAIESTYMFKKAEECHTSCAAMQEILSQQVKTLSETLMRFAKFFDDIKSHQPPFHEPTGTSAPTQGSPLALASASPSPLCSPSPTLCTTSFPPGLVAYFCDTITKLVNSKNEALVKLTCLYQVKNIINNLDSGSMKSLLEPLLEPVNRAIEYIYRLKKPRPRLFTCKLKITNEEIQGAAIKAIININYYALKRTNGKFYLVFSGNNVSTSESKKSMRFLNTVQLAPDHPIVLATQHLKAPAGCAHPEVIALVETFITDQRGNIHPCNGAFTTLALDTTCKQLEMLYALQPDTDKNLDYLIQCAEQQVMSKIQVVLDNYRKVNSAEDFREAAAGLNNMLRCISHLSSLTDRPIKNHLNNIVAHYGGQHYRHYILLIALKEHLLRTKWEMGSKFDINAPDIPHGVCLQLTALGANPRALGPAEHSAITSPLIAFIEIVRLGIMAAHAKSKSRKESTRKYYQYFIANNGKQNDLSLKEIFNNLCNLVQLPSLKM